MFNVTIRDLPPLRLAVMPDRGDYQAIGPVFHG
jgi:DNA gyrase inhibitor GyrI